MLPLIVGGHNLCPEALSAGFDVDGQRLGSLASRKAINNVNSENCAYRPGSLLHTMLPGTVRKPLPYYSCFSYVLTVSVYHSVPNDEDPSFVWLLDLSTDIDSLLVSSTPDRPPFKQKSVLLFAIPLPN